MRIRLYSRVLSLLLVVMACTAASLVAMGTVNPMPVRAATAALDNTPAQSRGNAQKPLPLFADLRSPRNVLESFYTLVDSFHDLVRKDGFTSENSARVQNLGRQIAKLFDLRNIPPKFRQNVADETAIYLREVTARLPLPALSQVPDEDQMANRVKNGKTAVYRIPGTPIVIKEIREGEYEGLYQFTQDVIDGAPDWYRMARSLPYRPGQMQVQGLYDAYFLTPGPLIPLKLIRSLPDWMKANFMEQAVWQWLFLFVCICALIAAIIGARLIAGRIMERSSSSRRNLAFLLWNIVVIVLTLGIRYFIDREVFITGRVLQAVSFPLRLVVLVAAVNIVMRLGGVLAESILASSRFQSKQINGQLIRLGARMLAMLISMVVILEGLKTIGFSLATLVAGASVSGLAVALAAQDTLRNIFGGIELSLDKPFEVGQRVMIKGYNGTIEGIGLRSTKIRTLTGHLVSIPNEDVAKIDIENIGKRSHIRRVFNITITYDTPPEKIRRAIGILQDILSVPEAVAEQAPRCYIQSPDFREGEGVNEEPPHPNQAINYPDYPPRVYFDDLKADALNIVAFYWYHPPDYWEYLAHATWINTQIMDRFNAEGIDFAFPTQTLHLAGDDKRPLVLDQHGNDKDPG